MMSEIKRNYYTIKPETDTHAKAVACAEKIESVQQQRVDYMKETFGTTKCYMYEGGLIAAVPTELPGLRPDKRNKGFFVPALGTKKGKEFAAKWSSLKDPKYDAVFDAVGADIAFVQRYMCYPVVLNIDGVFYLSNVAKLDHPDLQPVKQWEVEKAIDEYNESLETAMSGTSTNG